MGIPARWISVDPGDAHVGITSWVGERAVKCIETDPDGCMRTLELVCEPRVIELIVCEKWLLYPDAARSMIWNEFETCQLIGKIKYLCQRTGVVYVGQLASQGKSLYKTEWFRKMPLAQKKAMPWYGVKSVTGGKKEDHAKDSWAHGRYYIKHIKGTWDVDEDE